MNMEYLEEFEKLNETTDSVFDLGESGILIILKDGTNLTSWGDVGDVDDVLYLSEDLSKQNTRSRARLCDGAEVMIIQNFTDCRQLVFVRDSIHSLFYNMKSLKAFYGINWDLSNETDLRDLFMKCYNMEYAFFDNWNTSNVENFWGMFADCCSLKTLEGVENWDLSSAVKMESMFESCLSLEDISFASDWDMSHVENIFEMFRDCYSLKDASCLNWKFDNIKDGDDIFINCSNLENLPEWYDDEFRGQFGIRKHLENIDDDSFLYKIVNGFNLQDTFVAVSYIKDENMLKELVNDSSTHYYARRAALRNPNLKDMEILEEYAVNSNEPVERAYAIENPNFNNAKILNRIAKEDENYVVRFKAVQRLKEMMYNKFTKLDNLDD